MKYLLLAIMLCCSFTLIAQQRVDQILGSTKEGKVTFRYHAQNSDTTFLLQYPDEISGKYGQFTIADTSLLKRGFVEVLSDREFRLQYNEATITNNGKGNVAFSSPVGLLRLTTNEYNELFNSDSTFQSNISVPSPQPETRVVDTVRKGDTVFIIQQSSTPLTGTPIVKSPTQKVKKEEEQLAVFYTNMHLYYATNRYLLDTLAGHGGGFNFSMGAFFKYGFTIGLGGGVFTTYYEQDRETLEIMTIGRLVHFPLFVEGQYVGKRGKFAPYASVQAGMVISFIEDIAPIHQNENANFLAGKLGIAIPMGKKKNRKTKFLLYGGASVVNIADNRFDKTFWTAGLGFSY